MREINRCKNTLQKIVDDVPVDELSVKFCFSSISMYWHKLVKW